MGVFQKLKDIFYDEEIIEEEIPEEKTEEKPKIKEIIEPKIERFTATDELKPDIEDEKVTEEIDIPRFDEPKREEPPKPVIRNHNEETRERELFQSKQTFNFPILNDDIEEEKPRTRSNINVMDLEKKARLERKETEVSVERENSTFKPSPVISPVYGILDKNFKKEDIVSRNRKNDEVISRQNSSFAYDTVRKKAYGSLDKDEEVKEEAKKILNEVETIEQELDKIESNTDKTIDDIVKKDDRITVGELEEQTKRIELNEDVEDITREIKIEETSRIEKYKEPEEEKKKISDVGDKTLEHDLFNLIDSMYDDDEEE